MIHRIEIATKSEFREARGEHVAAQIRKFLALPAQRVRTSDVYRIDADLQPQELDRIVEHFADPVLQVCAIDRGVTETHDVVIEVGFQPGVMDPVGQSAKVAIEDLLGRSLDTSAQVFSSVLYFLDGLDCDQGQQAAIGLLGNPLIQTIRVASFEEWIRSEPDRSTPKIIGGATPLVQRIDLSGSSDELVEISRKGLLALSLAEMESIRDHFNTVGEDSRRKELGLGPSPTDVELECLAQTWSEHCKHKIFNAEIVYRKEGEEPEVIDSLFDNFIRGTTEEIDRNIKAAEGESWLVSGFHDNAGVVAFDDQVHLVFKVETHNSPSALDPYGGAMTGIVGVNRDPFGTGRGANLLVNVWGYCFASPFHDEPLPRGLLHPRRIRDGVHQGVIDGGNQSGIPYGRGWEIFDHRYLGKPLVFCGTIGTLPKTIDGTPGEFKQLSVDDLVVMVGGRIGADGIHGATFSSEALDEGSPTQAVQIGDPITQKMMFDFLIAARDRGLYSSITDNGAGGLSSSIGEMATATGGARIDLSRAPLKYSGLAPWEIFLSEAQERMTLAVPDSQIEDLLALAARYQVEATVLGSFTDSGFLHVTWGEETVAHLDMDFLHSGNPKLRLEARWESRNFAEPLKRPADCQETLMRLLSRPNLASNEAKARHYDHEVKGLTVIKPFIGVENDVPAEATVFLARHGSRRGIVLSEGVNPFISELDPRAMATTAVDEAIRRQICAGAGLSRIAALDNFCWPDPVLSRDTPDGDFKLGQLVRACQGLHEICLSYGVPLISGKDSMKNEAILEGKKIAVLPTLLVSAIGQIEDVETAVTLDFKVPGDVIYILGETGNHTGGSEYFRYLGDHDGCTGEPGLTNPYVGSAPPVVDMQRTLPLYQALRAAIKAGFVRSAATPTKGGLALALVRSVLAGGLGASIDLTSVANANDLDSDVALFSESNGRFVVSLSAEDTKAFEQCMQHQQFYRVGLVDSSSTLRVNRDHRSLVNLEIDDLRHQFKRGLEDA
jgi:phosphoribosylformylglycinamidine synthase